MRHMVQSIGAVVGISAALVFAQPALARPTLFAARINTVGPPPPSGELYSVTLDGAVSYIGNSGFDGLAGLTCLPNGLLYGSLGGEGGNGSIITVDRFSGAGSSVGASGFSKVEALASSPSGVIYASATNGTCTDTLVTIDPSTGAATVIGTFGAGIGGMDGLAFDASGTLFGTTTSDCDSVAGPALYRINPATGAATLVATLTQGGNTFDSDAVTGLEVLPGGDLWATTDGTTNDIVAINPTTAVVTNIGSSATNGELTALAFCGCDAAPDPSASCDASAVSSSVGITKKTDPAKDKLDWKWSKATVADGDFGDPTSSTSYVVCAYNDSALVSALTVPHGGTCGDKPCWAAVQPTGFKYGNRGFSQSGVTAMKLKSGAGKAQMALKAKGSNLPVPSTLPLQSTSGLLVQLFRSDAVPCWQVLYTPPARKDASDSFKDKLP